MRIAVSGSHGTGKSTLIAAFLARCPHYTEEPEAFELLGDDITLLPGEGPDIDGLAMLIEHTIEVFGGYQPGASVVFERCPADYLAYAVASESISAPERVDFLERYAHTARDAIEHLDLVVLLPTSSAIPASPEDDEGFRDRVDDALRCALVDDEHDLFGGPGAPRVVELSSDPERRLAELVQLASTG